MNVVSAAPLLPRSSFSTWTMSSWPSFSGSWMPARRASTPSREVLAGDFLERQEAVAVVAVVDEAGFERRLDAGDDGLVDVALALFLARGFDVEVDEFLAIDDGDAQFFRLRRVDQHAFHVIFPSANLGGGRAGKADGARDRRAPGSNGRRARARKATRAACAAGLRGTGCGCLASLAGWLKPAPGGAGRPVSKAWWMFFALSLKRSGDCGAALARRAGRRSRSVQSDAEFVALESVFARRASCRFTPATGRCGDCALPLTSLLFRVARPGR